MECPYCNKEMEKGVIQSQQEIAWHKEKHMFIRADMHKGSICLSQFSFLKGSSVDAWLCRDCNKIIIDYAETSE